MKNKSNISIFWHILNLWKIWKKSISSFHSETGRPKVTDIAYITVALIYLIEVYSTIPVCMVLCKDKKIINYQCNMILRREELLIYNTIWSLLYSLLLTGPWFLRQCIIFFSILFYFSVISYVQVAGIFLFPLSMCSARVAWFT